MKKQNNTHKHFGTSKIKVLETSWCDGYIYGENPSDSSKSENVDNEKCVIKT
jgi:hypothetical protein